MTANGEHIGNLAYHEGKTPGAMAGFYSLPNGVVYAWAFNSWDKDVQYLWRRLLPELGQRTEWPEHDLFPLYFNHCQAPCTGCSSNEDTAASVVPDGP